MVVDKLGGASAKGKVIIGNCFPGFPVLENRARGVEESLKAAPGLTVLGPFDVKVSAVDNYNHWEQLYAANPDAVALVGLCAPDVASLGKLNAANGDKFVAGGYDLTAAQPRGHQGRPRLCHPGPERLRPGLSAGGAAGRCDQAEEAAAGRLLQRRNPGRDRRQRGHGQRPAGGDLRPAPDAGGRPGGDRGLLQALVQTASGAATGRAACSPSPPSPSEHMPL